MRIELLLWMTGLLAFIPGVALLIGLLYALVFRDRTGSGGEPVQQPPTFSSHEAPTDPNGFNIKTEKISDRTTLEAERRIAESRRREQGKL